MTNKQIDVNIANGYKATLTLPSNLNTSARQDMAISAKIQEVATEIFSTNTFQDASRILATLTNSIANTSYEMVADIAGHELTFMEGQYQNIDTKINQLKALIWAPEANADRTSSSARPADQTKLQRFLNNGSNGHVKVLPNIPSNGIAGLRKVPIGQLPTRLGGSGNKSDNSSNAADATSSNSSTPLAPSIGQPLARTSSAKHSSNSGPKGRDVQKDIRESIAASKARRLSLTSDQQNPVSQMRSRNPLIIRGSDSGRLAKLTEEERLKEAQLQLENTIGQTIRNRVANQTFDSRGNLVYKQIQDDVVVDINDDSARLTLVPQGQPWLDEPTGLELYNKINKISDFLDNSISQNSEKIEQDRSLEETVELYQDFRSDILESAQHTSDAEHLPLVLKTLQSYSKEIISKLMFSTKTENYIDDSAASISSNDGELFSQDQLALGGLVDSDSETDYSDSDYEIDDSTASISSSGSVSDDDLAESSEEDSDDEFDI